MRSSGPESREGWLGVWEVIGRSGIVREGYSHDWDIPEDKSKFKADEKQSITLRMDIETLTRLNLNSLDLTPKGNQAQSR